jgi:hypothetical protein
MSDPIAEAAANLNDAAPSSTEPQQSAPEVAPAGEPSSSPSSGEAGAGEVGNADASTSLAGAARDASIAEHPHTTILRRLTETLRRKWNVFDGELEAILKDAESRL